MLLFRPSGSGFCLPPPLPRGQCSAGQQDSWKGNLWQPVEFAELRGGGLIQMAWPESPDGSTDPSLGPSVRGDESIKGSWMAGKWMLVTKPCGLPLPPSLNKHL